MKKKINVVKGLKSGFPKDITVVRREEKKNAKAAEAGRIEERDPRLPAVGSVITRHYKGEELKVKVLDNGFECNGQLFKSLSGLAVHIVGGQISGYVFFKL